MGSKSLVSHDCLSAWEVILPERLDPIKRFAKIERNFDLNQVSFNWGFSLKRFDNRFRSYQVEFGKELRFKKLLVEVIQESVTKMSANMAKRCAFMFGTRRQRTGGQRRICMLSLKESI